MTTISDKYCYLSEFKWLQKFGPSYSVKAENVSVYLNSNDVAIQHTLNIAYFFITIVQITALKSPSEFYRTLLDRCRTAKHRIVIASLYLGIGNLEQELVSNICMDCFCDVTYR